MCLGCFLCGRCLYCVIGLVCRWVVMFFYMVFMLNILLIV